MAKSKSAGKTAVWILMGLLILGLGGFGATSFSSSVRSVGSVGDRDITTAEYGRALQTELRALEAQAGQAISFEQAEQLGIDRQVLSRLILEASIDNEADRIGMSVGDETLAKQLQGIPAFRGIDGKFDRDAYRFTLDRSGLSESEFESGVRRETARALLQGAVVAGAALPDSYIDTVLNYFAERRRVTWARIEGTSLDTDSYEPSENDLQALYEERISDFTRPELKKITYAWLTPDMLIDTVEVDEALLRDAYDARSDRYNQPERRLVERLIYADEGRAAEARSALDSGASTFDDLVEARGLSLDDIDMGDVSQDQLDEAGEAVFTAQSGDVVGPIATGLGPAFFRVNGILSAESTSFEEALPELRQELASDRARRQVEAEAEPAEDMLASGATLEELAADTVLELGTIDWAPQQGEGIAAYSGFDEAAAALTEDDYPEIMYLDDGGIYAMRLEEIVAPEPIPFAEVRDRVRGIWETRRQMERLREIASDRIVKLQEATDFSSLGLEVQTEEALTRQGSVMGAPATFVERAFSMEPGEIGMVDGFGAVIILRVDEILPPNLEDPDVQAMRDSLEQQLQSSAANDLYRAYSETLRQSAGVELDHQAVAAVNANFR